VFSDLIKSTLERDVVGQTRAVDSVVHGVTRMASGVTPRERDFCCYLFVGPTGTGKTHLIRTLARILHGDEQHMVVADCTPVVRGDPWNTFVSQLAPLFAPSSAGGRWGGALEAPPLSIIRVESLERAPEEVCKALAVALDTGRIMLPEGRSSSLRNCLLFLTTGLCSREILDEAPRIGFAGSPEEDTEEERIRAVCFEQAAKSFGPDLVGRLDGLVVFHRLQDEHLATILDRRFERLRQWLSNRGSGCRMEPAARAFLLERGRGDLRRGATDLIRAHREFIEFPVADLLISGRIPLGGLLGVDRRAGEDHLHFTIAPRTEADDREREREVPVVWDEGRAAADSGRPVPPAANLPL
jgi:ATP-dependent Clp protease ATP-binding subunit ClpA